MKVDPLLRSDYCLRMPPDHLSESQLSGPDGRAPAGEITLGRADVTVPLVDVETELRKT